LGCSRIRSVGRSLRAPTAKNWAKFDESFTARQARAGIEVHAVPLMLLPAFCSLLNGGPTPQFTSLGKICTCTCALAGAAMSEPTTAAAKINRGLAQAWFAVCCNMANSLRSKRGFV
jgi:hypothetical protein